MSTPKCTYSIRTQLTNFAAGGIWTYVGYNSSSDAGPWSETPVTPLVPEVAGSVINRGDNFSIITDNKSFGYYRFNYTLNGTTVSLTVRVIDDTITAGTSKSLILSTSSSPVNLLTQLGASAGGTWTDVNNAGAAFANNILTPTTLTPGNIYRFTYSLKNNYTPGGCTACPPLEATITVSIQSVFTGRIDSNDDTCTVTMTLVHPDTSVSNQAKVTVPTNALSPVLTVKRVITDCNNVVVNELVTNIKAVTEVTIGASMTTGNNLQTSGFLETLTLNNSAGGTVTVPLAPSGANQAVFSGIGGNITASSLTYQGINNPAFASAIKTAIVNYLGTQNFTENTNYRVYVTSTDGYVSIRLSAKHNPSTAWLGFNQLAYKITSTSGNTTVSGNSKFSGESPIDVFYNGSPCPSSLVARPVFADTIVDLATTTYTSISIKANTHSFTLANTSVMSSTCPAKLLTAVGLNCNGVLTYAWNYGGVTTSTVKVITKGIYTVTISCSNPAGSIPITYEYV